METIINTIIYDMEHDEKLREEVNRLYHENEKDYLGRNPEGKMCSLFTFLYCHGDALCVTKMYFDTGLNGL